MEINFKRWILGLIVSLITLACDKKSELKSDVLFLVEPFHAEKDSVLKIRLINNSSSNYYITMDTNRTYNYSAFNDKLNNSIILRPSVYNNGKLIALKSEGFVRKTIGIDKYKMECISEEVKKSDKFYKDYVMMKNAIVVKSKSSKYMEIPFLLNFKTCYYTYNYDIEKGEKYELQLEYQMSKETTEKWISKSKVDSLNKLSYAPYYKKIISNKIFLILK